MPGLLLGVTLALLSFLDISSLLRLGASQKAPPASRFSIVLWVFGFYLLLLTTQLRDRSYIGQLFLYLRPVYASKVKKILISLKKLP
jgi:hypothetical protein